jgi:glycosyltransferase involved in cell wall biosynthesis
VKIAMVVNNLTVSGGYQKLVLRLERELRLRGHDVSVYTQHVDRDACYPADIATSNVHSVNEGAEPPLVSWAALVRMFPPDIDGLILHDEVSLEALLHLDDRPPRILWMLNNELGFLEAKFSPRQLIRDAWMLRRPRPVVRKIGEAFDAARQRQRLRKAAKLVRAFAVYDEANARAVERRLSRTATVVYAGADIDVFEACVGERPVTTAGSLHVVSVGVLFPHRRYEDLIDALPLVGRNVSVTIVGLHSYHPEYARRLRERTKDLQVEDRVTFREYVSDAELRSLYNASNAFVFVNDGLTWGIAVFEALAAGLPAIVSNTAGASELLAHGRHAWIVPARHPAAIAAALAEIADFPEEARRRVDCARQEVLGAVRWSAFAERIEEVLDKIDETV